ncbi:protein kinase domain-containing protein [Nannocystis pusilla]|uniref:serine/threonine-protein kinase n=1 Tax=Nannocystis pusilla TaxID=889268 RepID=UPI003DA3E743
MVADSELTGSVLDGRYRLIQRLGAGGMGTVYRGEHVMLGTELAVKVLSPKFAHDPEWIQRFLLEARAASRIRHPNIVQMHDFGAPRPGLVYMVMELLEGESLADLARREKSLPWRRVAVITEQIAGALAAAHARGIIHRDIKPANIFRVGQPEDPDFIKVLDFGIAKFLSGADEDVESPSTATGALMGTPEYIAPELFIGQRPDARVDVYALGVLMYKLLTGRVPFPGSHIVVAQQIATGRPVAPSRNLPPERSVPPEVDALILRALRREPEERTPTMRDLVDELRASSPNPIDTAAATASRDSAATSKSAARAVLVLPAHSLPPSGSDEFGEESTLRRNVSPIEPITEPKPTLPEPEPAHGNTVRELGSPVEKAAAPPRSRPWLIGAALLGMLGVVPAIWISRTDGEVMSSGHLGDQSLRLEVDPPVNALSPPKLEPAVAAPTPEPPGVASKQEPPTPEPPGVASKQEPPTPEPPGVASKQEPPTPEPPGVASKQEPPAPEPPAPPPAGISPPPSFTSLTGATSYRRNERRIKQIVRECGEQGVDKNLTLGITIDGQTGHARAEVRAPALAIGEPVSACVIHAIQTLRFAKFTGEPFKIEKKFEARD